MKLPLGLDAWEAVVILFWVVFNVLALSYLLVFA